MKKLKVEASTSKLIIMKNKLIIFPILFLLFSFKSDNGKINYSQIISKYKGSVIYIDLWASWCSPCMKEIKKMHNVKEHYKDKNIVFLYITMDLDRDKCNKAIDQNKIIEKDRNYYIIDIEKDNKYSEIVSNRSIPQYLIYDKEGVLRNTNAPGPSKRKELYKELDKYLDLE